MPSPSSTSNRIRRTARRPLGRPRHERARTRREPGRASPRPLGHYTDACGRRREVIARKGAAGSVLVLDRDVATRGDRRLVAHLAADEPAGNAALVCGLYLGAGSARLPNCRVATVEDTRATPPTDCEQADLGPERELEDRRGCSYRLERIDTGMSIPELRWQRRAQDSADPPETVSTREVIARLESYEPARTLTLRALAGHRRDARISTTVLRAELERVLESPIVLNRRLRELTLRTVERQELSMSEIAIRCGRVKRDSKGNLSGETSWLARRLGLLPEGGQSSPTPWVHSDVLALIARRGLGLSPREVELT